jgi:hypothetical protein
MGKLLPKKRLKPIISHGSGLDEAITDIEKKVVAREIGFPILIKPCWRRWKRNV